MDVANNGRYVILEKTSKGGRERMTGKTLTMTALRRPLVSAEDNGLLPLRSS